MFCFVFENSIAQQKEVVYLLFDSKSESPCIIPESQRGRYHSEIDKVKDLKLKQKDGSVVFYICKESFHWDNNSKIDTCVNKNLEKIRFSNLSDLIRTVNNENPLYPNKVFKNVYLIEKVNDSVLLKYNVDWRYYVE